MAEAILDTNTTGDSTIYSLGVLEVHIKNLVNSFLDFESESARSAVDEYMQTLSKRINDELHRHSYDEDETRFIYSIDSVEFGSIISKIPLKLEVPGGLIDVAGRIALVLSIITSEPAQNMALCYKSDRIDCEIVLETKSLSAFIEVNYGDSVYSIIEDEGLATDFTLEQVAVAIFEANRHAFPADNISVLSADTVLLIPPKEVINRYSAYRAKKLYRRYGG